MLAGRRACVLLALSFFATDAKLSETCAEEGLFSSATPLPQALLQAHRTVNPTNTASFIADAKAELYHTAPNVKEEDPKAPNGLQTVESVTKVNLTGAAAPLTKEGYLAVADRLSQTEMKQFIERLIDTLDLLICDDPGGLEGIVQYHTIPDRAQSFDKLTTDLLAFKDHCFQRLFPSATPLSQARQQARRTINPIDSASFVADAKAAHDHTAPIAKEEDLKAPEGQETVEAVTKVNPSGAAAPLTNEGYLAVADRWCQTEMKQFIERLIFHLNLQICEDPGGLAGIVQYHTTPHRPQSFDKLTADLLADSTPRCRWLAPKSETCTRRPEDCEKFEGVIADCGCSRSAAAKLDFTAVSIPTNNLAGLGPGPSTDPKEIRYSAGVSSEGEAFELVVTAIGTYTPKDSSSNGHQHGFGKINIMGNTTSSFRFSIVEPGTNTPVILKEVHLAIFDLDGIYVTGLESVSSKGYHGYVTDENPSVVVSLAPDGTASFTGDPGDAANPTGPNALTEDQRRNSIMFFYKDVSSFELAFGAPSTQKTTSGRPLFFAFKSSLDSRCAK